MANWIYTFVCFTATIALGSCQISCYDCEPSNYGAACADPVKNNVRTVVCSPDVENGTAICLSAYLNFTDARVNSSGIYRGCKTLRPDVNDFCDWFKQENNGANQTVVTCVNCNSTRCNTVGFNSDGSSGAGTVSTAVFVLVLNAILFALLGILE